VETLWIPLAYILSLTIALWFIIGCRGFWLLKTAIIGVVAYIGICIWITLPTFEGWSTKSPLPVKFEIKWADVKEPNKKTGDNGVIFVWIQSLCVAETKTFTIDSLKPFFVVLHQRDQIKEPRLHQLPYSRSGHQQANEIQNIIKDGGKFFGTTNKGGTGKEGQNGNGDGSNSGDGGSLSQEQVPMFYQLPPPHFPAKDEHSI